MGTACSYTARCPLRMLEQHGGCIFFGTCHVSQKVEGGRGTSDRLATEDKLAALLAVFGATSPMKHRKAAGYTSMTPRGRDPWRLERKWEKVPLKICFVLHSCDLFTAGRQRTEARCWLTSVGPGSGRIATGEIWSCPHSWTVIRLRGLLSPSLHSPAFR